MHERTRAVLNAAMKVPGINRVEIRIEPDDTLAGSVRYSESGIFGDDTGPAFDIRQTPDGVWTVTLRRDYRDRDLTAAIHRAVLDMKART